MLLVTIGPKTSSLKNLNLISKHSNFFRLNGSHGNIKWHESVSRRIKKIDKNIKILLDIPGIKMRTLNKKNTFIKKEELVLFYYKNKPLKKIKKIELSNPIPSVTKKTKNFTISDGNFDFKIINIKKNFIIGKSKQTFSLLPKQGINLPFSYFDEKFQKNIILNFLKKIKNIKHDLLGISFIQSKKIIDYVKKNTKNKLIVSKIENYKGLKNFKEIVLNSDYVMVDRGDLLAELGNTNLFKNFYKILKYSLVKKVPFIAATGNLESMLIQNRPFKSEIFTLGFYKFMKVKLVMLSEETAISKNWLKIIKWYKNHF